MLRTVNRIRNLPREREVVQVIARHNLGYILRRYAFGRFLLRFTGTPSDERLPVHWGDELRAMLEELGPTYIKLGQVLSIRPDLLPPDVLQALRGLRDEVRPVPFAEIRTVIEGDLGATLEELFDSFDERPIGSASIGQAYVAYHAGVKVAVKVQRPSARSTVEKDLAVLADIADVVKRRNRDLFFDPVSLVGELRQFLYSELDYMEEARNTDRVRTNFEGDERVRIPGVHWDRTGSRVLTTEFIEGVPLTRLDPTKYSMEDRRRLAALGAEVSMTQVFEHGCFHGDAHPSNIFVITPEKYGLIDFGLVGYISEREMRYITDFLVHLIRQQTDRLVRDLKSLGIVVPRGREDDVANAYASILRRYYGVTLAQIDTVRLVNELLDVIYRNHMRLPTKYFLVLRGLTTVEGTGRELYPDFNVFEVAEPYVRRMALRRYSPTTLASENIDRAVELADIVGRYPQQLGDVLDELQDTLREVRRLEEIVGQTTRSATRFINRVAAAILLAALVIGAPRVELQPHLFGVPVLSAMMLATAFFLGLWLLFGLYRSGGL